MVNFCKVILLISINMAPIIISIIWKILIPCTSYLHYCRNISVFSTHAIFVTFVLNISLVFCESNIVMRFKDLSQRALHKLIAWCPGPQYCSNVGSMGQGTMQAIHKRRLPLCYHRKEHCLILHNMFEAHAATKWFRCHIWSQSTISFIYYEMKGAWKQNRINCSVNIEFLI